MPGPATDATPIEFADLLAGFPEGVAPPPIQRRWVTTSAGGHVSGVFWHTERPRVLLLHEAGSSARSWDDVLPVLDRPAVALDLPGHGRSNWRGRGDYRPRRLAGTVTEAAHSFAPAGVPVVGRGLGALVAIAAADRTPARFGRLVLVDTLPGTLAQRDRPWPTPSPDFADQDEARDWLAARLDPASGAAPAPLLVRTQGGPLEDGAVDRFTTEVPAGEVAAVATGPAAPRRPAVLTGPRRVPALRPTTVQETPP